MEKVNMGLGTTTEEICNSLGRKPFRQYMIVVIQDHSGNGGSNFFNSEEEAMAWAYKCGYNDDWFMLYRWSARQKKNVLVNEGNL